MGVHLFFVLSGFLITGILLDSRHKPDYYKGFYLRRILRILPAYLVAIVFLKAVHTISWRYVPVALLYVANICSLFHVQPEYGPLWSLSVEEQFYLVWPVAVRKTTQRGLLWLSIFIIAASPLLRFCLLFGPKFISDFLHKTWGVADFFAAGAILAIAIRSPKMQVRLRRIALPLLAAGLITLAIALSIPDAANHVLHNLEFATNQEPFLILWSAVVMLAYLHPRIAQLRILAPLVFLADISYGLYLYHQYIFTTVERHWTIAAGTPGQTLALLIARFAVESLLSILVAWISRRTLEEFFLRLKPKTRPATH